MLDTAMARRPHRTLRGLGTAGAAGAGAGALLLRLQLLAAIAAAARLQLSSRPSLVHLSLLPDDDSAGAVQVMYSTARAPAGQAPACSEVLYWAAGAGTNTTARGRAESYAKAAGE